MKNENYSITCQNVESHYKEHQFSGSREDENGTVFMAKICTSDRMYYSLCRVDQSIETVILEITPGIHCESPYRDMCSSYICDANARFKSGNIRMDKCGHIYVHITQSFADAPISIKFIEHIERLLISVLDDHEKALDRIAHGHLPADAKPEEDESDRLSRIRHIIDSLESGSGEDSDVSSSDTASDDDSDDDSDDGRLDQLFKMFSHAHSEDE